MPSEPDASLAMVQVSDALGAISTQAGQRPVARVGVGDTSAFSDDVPVHASPLLPGASGPYMSTGAGDGHANPFRPGGGA